MISIYCNWISCLDDILSYNPSIIWHVTFYSCNVFFWKTRAIAWRLVCHLCNWDQTSLLKLNSLCLPYLNLLYYDMFTHALWYPECCVMHRKFWNCFIADRIGVISLQHLHSITSGNNFHMNTCEYRKGDWRRSWWNKYKNKVQITGSTWVVVLWMFPIKVIL